MPLTAHGCLWRSYKQRLQRQWQATLVEIVGFVVVVVVGFFILFFVFLEGEDFGGSSDDLLPACALKSFCFF